MPPIGPPNGISEMHSGNGRADHSRDLRRIILIHRQHGVDDHHIVAKILREQGADRPVDHARGQNCLFRRFPLSLDKAAGIFPTEYSFSS